MSPPGRAPAPRRRSRRHAGLATLEWLLVVSVSALLAALVIAHVQRNVDRGVTLIADASDAGLGAPGSLDRAQALADELAYRVQVASLQYDPRDYRFQDPSFWSDHFSTRCRRIREIFSDIAAEDVQVTVETDFRFGAIEIAGQRINPREIGEIPWVFGEQGHDPDLLRRGVFDQSERGRYVPAQTVCQVFLSHGGSRTPPP
ncbi:MAG: hypothetical protein OXP08_09305 [bacterium]|nr:hypothetical protein [bacterium]